MSIKSDIKIIGNSLYEILLQPFITMSTWLLFNGTYLASIVWVVIIAALLNYMFN